MTETHIGDLKLRRLRAGESLGAEATVVTAHAAACAQCRARLKDLDDEQRRFEQTISFDRFAAGVERAARRPTPLAATRAGTRWLYPALGAAAALVLITTIGRGGGERTTTSTSTTTASHASNRIKGGADVVVRVGGATGEGGERGQRIASPDALEALAPGERLRIGYKAGAHRYLTAVSLDDQGHASAIYPEAGRSLTLPSDSGGELRYLPDSVELTGTGAERIVIVLGDEALDVDAVKRAAEDAYRQAKGDILHLPALNLAGEQFHRTFRKP